MLAQFRKENYRIHKIPRVYFNVLHIKLVCKRAAMTLQTCSRIF